VSVGRDEQLRLWDGLLGSDWIGRGRFILHCKGIVADEFLLQIRSY
jgi:hypothetical protein